MHLKIGSHVIEVTHPDKIIFGKSGFTKQNLIDYYHAIASIMIPHIKNRPISMQRFPQGIHEDIFFQKDAADYFPSWIQRYPIPKQTGGTVEYITINTAATLIYLANQACVPHIWLSKVDRLEKPDRLIFDLDPAHEHSFDTVQKVARHLKEVLDHLELPSFYMLTGSRGAHIVIPLKRIHTFDTTRSFAYDIAQLLAYQFPTLITIDMHKSKRGKRIFLDWLRNGFGATTVAPYAIRALEGAPIAVPITWQELQKKDLFSQKYTIKNIAQYINKNGDIWHDMDKHAVPLKSAQKKLALLLKKEL